MFADLTTHSNHMDDSIVDDEDSHMGIATSISTSSTIKHVVSLVDNEDSHMDIAATSSTSTTIEHTESPVDNNDSSMDTESCIGLSGIDVSSQDGSMSIENDLTRCDEVQKQKHLLESNPYSMESLIPCFSDLNVISECSNSNGTNLTNILKSVAVTNRLAIRLTLVLTIPKTDESLKKLKCVCEKIGSGNLYFYTVQESKNKPTETQVKSLLAEYGIKNFKYIQTNGCDTEIMDLEKITHIVDDRPRWLSNMLTLDGYIRNCYCIVSNPNLKHLRTENIKVFLHWLEMVNVLVEELDQPLRKYDHTECWKCNKYSCQGSCSEENLNLLTDKVVVSDTVKIVSWNVRSLRHCYRSGNFASFIKSTEARFVFLQEVSAAPISLLLLPGFILLLEEYGFCYRYWFPCQNKPHYSGVAVLARIKPDAVIKGFLNKVTDDPVPNLEGRIITVIWNGKAIVGSYFPTLSIKEVGKDKKVLSRMEFQRQFNQHLEHSIFDGKEIILTGDLNTTVDDTDLTYWRKNVKPFPADFPSTTPMEREFLHEVMNKFTLLDAAKSTNGDSRMTFRGSYFLYPGLSMRLDLFLVQKSIPIISFQVLSQFLGSDHVPIQLEIGNSANCSTGISKHLYTLEEHKQISLEPDLVIKKCWSLTRRGIGTKYVCKNPKTCMYSHLCVCNIEECLGDCEEMKQYSSQYLFESRSKRERKNFISSVSSTSKPLIAFDKTSPAELHIGQMFEKLPVLLEPLYPGAAEDRTLFSGVMSLIDDINTSFLIPTTEEKLNTAETKSKKASVKISEELYSSARLSSIDEETEVCDIIIDEDKPEVLTDTHVEERSLKDILVGLDPLTFTVTTELRDAIVKTEVTDKTLPIFRLQSLFQQVENRRVKEEEALPQLDDEIWKLVQTLHYMQVEYQDVHRVFQHSPRYYTLQWGNLTPDDITQFTTYFYPVRNMQLSLDQLGVKDENHHKIMMQVIRQCYTATEKSTYVEKSQTEQMEEVEYINVLGRPNRTTYCPHVSIVVNNSIVPVLSLVDTGATYCIITRAYLKTVLSESEIRKQQKVTKVQLLVANGQVTKPLKKINLSFQVGTKAFMEDFYIMENEASYQMILGVSFMNEHDISLNFKEQTLTIPNKGGGESNDSSIQQCEIARFCIMEGVLQRPPVALYCVEDTIVEPYSECVIRLKMSDKNTTEYDGKFGEVWCADVFANKTSMRGAIGFNYQNKDSYQGYTVINPTGKPLLIKKNVHVAEYYPSKPEYYGLVFNTGSFAEEDEPSGVLHSAEFTKVGPDKAEGINIPACVGTDYTDQGGYREIKPAHLIPDFSQHELDEMFKHKGLSDLVLHPHKEKPAGCTLPDELTDMFYQMIAKRQQVFSKNNMVPLPVKHYSVEIPWVGQPRQAGIRPYSPDMIDIYKAEILPFTECGVLIPSLAPWRSAVMLVLKPDGKSWRMVSDFRVANKQVPKRNWPLPRIEATLTAITGAKYFSSVDQNNCYFQIPLSNERSRSWATIQTPLGVFSYTRCPQGYINSQADLMRFMDLYVNAGLSWRCCLAYCDDELMWSKTALQHIKDIDSVLCRIEFFGIQLKASKCEFFTPRLIFLGFEISTDGIRPSPTKATAISKLELPQTAKGLKGFCAKLNYYHNHFKNLSESIAHLSDLQKHDVVWPHEYTEQEKKEFEDAKAHIISDKVMVAIRDPAYKLSVDADASKHGLGGALIQLSKPERPIMFCSRKLSPAERLYHSYALEVLGAVFAVSVFRPWIVFEEFTLRIDCVALRWLLTTDQSSMFIRWVMVLCEYRIGNIIHNKGKPTHAHVDFLSRYPVHDEGYYGERKIEKLYCPTTSIKELVYKLDSAIEQQSFETVLSLMPLPEETALVIPDNIQGVDCFIVQDRIYLEVFTATQRLVYAIEKFGARQHLVETISATDNSRSVADISYLELLNMIQMTSCSPLVEVPHQDPPQLLLCNKPRKYPKIYTSIPIVSNNFESSTCRWKSSINNHLFSTTPWSQLTKSERDRVIEEEIMQDLEGEHEDVSLMLEGSELVLYYNKNFKKGSLLTTATLNSMINSNNLFAQSSPITVEDMLKQIVDPRNWGFVQHITVTNDYRQNNSALQYDTTNNNSTLRLVATRKIRSREKVCVPLSNVVQEVSKIRDKVVGIHVAMSKFLIPVIKQVNKYGNFAWSYLGTEEKYEVITSEIDNINDSKIGIRISEVPGKTRGVFATQFFPSKQILSCYTGEKLTSDQVDIRYPRGVFHAVYLFQVSNNLFVDARDPRLSNWTRWMNCPGVAERPNCIIEYNPRTQMLQVKTNRIIVPGEEFVISYGSKYHFMSERIKTRNAEVRKMYKLRGKRNVNIKDLQLNPPLIAEEELQEEEGEEEQVSDVDTDDDPIWEERNANDSVATDAHSIIISLQTTVKSLLKIVEAILEELQKLDKQVLSDSVNMSVKRKALCQTVSTEDPESWEPRVVKKPKLSLYDSNGEELSDKEIFAEVWRRQKVKIYHGMKEDLPQLFIDPNKNQPDKQYQIQNFDKLIENDEGSGDLVSHELLTKPIVSTTESELSFYFPYLGDNTIKQILQYTRKDGISTKLDEIISVVENEFEINHTNGLFRQWLLDDKQAQEIIVKLQEPESKSNEWLKRNFTYVDGLLYKNNLVQPTRYGINTTPYRERSIYVPNTVGVRETILRNYHGTLAAMHPGASELSYKIRASYYWSGIYENCRRWVKGCDLCMSRKVTHTGKNGLMTPTINSANQWPMNTLLMDFVHGLPTLSNGNNTLCTILCCFTRYGFCHACDGENSMNAAQALKRVICSTPYQTQFLVSDRGTAFNNEVIRILAEDFDIKVKITSTVSPVGGIENFNKFIVTSMSLILLAPHRRNHWEEYLDPIMMCHRSRYGEVGYSPNKLLFGIDSPNPFEIVSDRKKAEEGKTYSSAFRQEHIDVLKSVREIHRRSTMLHTMYKRMGQDKVEYKEGDIVLVYNISKPDKASPRHSTVGMIIKHDKGKGYAIVKVQKWGRWHIDTERVSNLKPYIPYSHEHFTTAPGKYTDVSAPPLSGYDETSPSPTELKEERQTENYVPIITEEKKGCYVGCFVVLPAKVWLDISHDKMPYSIARCIEIRNEEYGVFQRYGNLHGKLGYTRKLFPGYIHKYDKKYFYQEVARKDAIPYTNDLTDLGLPEQPILLKDVPFVFKTLVNHRVSRDVQREIDLLFPEVIFYHDSSQNQPK